MSDMSDMSNMGVESAQVFEEDFAGIPPSIVDEFMYDLALEEEEE